MKRTAVALALILIFFFSATGSAQLGLARANPSPGPLEVSIHSPNSYGQNSNTVLLNVSMTVFQDSLEGSENRWIAYSLDNQNNNTLVPHYQGVSIYSGYRFSVVTATTILWVPDGWHNITVYVKYNYGGWVNEGSARVEFVVGKPTSPNPNSPFVTINSPNSTQAFAENSPIPYSFTLGVPPSWFQNGQVTGKLYSVGYTLDNSGIMTTVAGRDMTHGGITVMNGSEPSLVPAFTTENPIVDLTGTIPPQPLGGHTITVYALWTDSGNENPMSTHFLGHFSVGTQTIQPPNEITELINQPFIAALVIGFTFSATIIGIGLLVYFKKRKPLT